jgi:hypothetical protein
MTSPTESQAEMRHAISGLGLQGPEGLLNTATVLPTPAAVYCSQSSSARGYPPFAGAVAVVSARPPCTATGLIS